jgi:hypothetical protein
VPEQPAIGARAGIQPFDGGRGEPAAELRGKHQDQGAPHEHCDQTGEADTAEHSRARGQGRGGALSDRDVVAGRAACPSTLQGTQRPAAGSLRR